MVKSRAKLNLNIPIPQSSLILILIYAAAGPVKILKWYFFVVRAINPTVNFRFAHTSKSGPTRAFHIALSVYTLSIIDSFRSLQRKVGNHYHFPC